MKKSSLKNHERSLLWDKQKAEKIMNQQIWDATKEITDAMVEQAKSGSFQHAAYLLDKAYGKPKQAVDIESGGQPIVFMPSTLVKRFALDEPIKSQVIEAEEVESKTKLKSFRAIPLQEDE